MLCQVWPFRRAAVTLFAAFLVVVPVSAWAQSDDMNAPKIAVIDMQRIMRESKAVQSIQSQIDKQRDAYQEDLSRKESELRQADEELRRQRTVLSSDAFNKKRQELEARVSKLQRDIQERKKKLDKHYSEAMRKVQQVLVKIVNDIALKRDVDVVLSKATVVMVRPELEITEPALRQLNRQLATVDVPNQQN